MIPGNMRFVVRRVNVTLLGGVSLEPLKFNKGQNMSVGIYAAEWQKWHFVNERNNVDPDKDPQFYFDLAKDLLRQKGLEP